MTPKELMANIHDMALSDFFANLVEVHNNFHVFDKITTPEIVLLEVILILFTIGSFFYLKKHQNKIIIRWFIGFIIFTLFQMFTASLFSAIKLGSWAYIYIKTSWIISTTWATFILWADYLANKFFKKYSIKNFLLSTLILSFFALFLEFIMIHLGIRVFSEETLEAFSQRAIALFPIYYSAIISLFVMSFYKYWNLKIDNKIIIPVKNNNLISFLICFLGILSFDIMTRTMVTNIGWCDWSYIIDNVSIELTFIGAILIWTSVTLIDKYLGYHDIFKKFILYFGISIVPIFFLEVFLINKGMRVYNEATVNNFSGLTIEALNMPLEIFFGSAFYLLIILPFITYIIFLVNQKK
jgi:hypothetical protein